MAANVRHIDSDGVTTITQQLWPDAFAGQNQLPKKFAFQNISDRPLGGAGVTVEIQQTAPGQDGHLQLRLADDVVTVPGPWGLTTAVMAGTGSWAIVGTKGYRVTSLSPIGESASAMEVTAALSLATNVVQLSWVNVPTATGFRVYRTDTPGSYGGTSRLTQVGAGVTMVLDGGGVLVGGSPPVDNRTAGWLTSLALSAPGAGGVWGTTGTRFFRVAAVDSTGVIIAASLENSINVDDVTKTVTISWEAVPDAATYRVYRSLSSGVYTSPALRATVVAPTTNFVDNGGAVVAGTLTTAPSYGVPPTAVSFTSGPLTPGTSIAINQTVFYWANRVVPVATPEAGNPRTAFVAVREA